MGMVQQHLDTAVESIDEEEAAKRCDMMTYKSEILSTHSSFLIHFDFEFFLRYLEIDFRFLMLMKGACNL